MNLGLAALVAGACYVAAPTAAASGLGAFARGQAYIVLRVFVRLQFMASTSLFQSRLAHAGYVARPAPRWPDSPAADAIEVCEALRSWVGRQITLSPLVIVAASLSFWSASWAAARSSASWSRLHSSSTGTNRCRCSSPIV